MRSCILFGFCFAFGVIVPVIGGESSKRPCSLDFEICFNGGTCYEYSIDGEVRFTCECPEHYSGSSCNITTDSLDRPRKIIESSRQGFVHVVVPILIGTPRQDGLQSNTTTATIFNCSDDWDICNQNGICKRGVQHGQNDYYACECFAGFYGSLCQYRNETTTAAPYSACEPNPCHNDCECVPSCQHDSGYYCYSSDGGFVGKNCTTEVLVVCGQDEIQVSISAEFYTEFDQEANNSYFYLTTNASGKGYANANGTATMISLTPSICIGRLLYDNYVFQIGLPFDECEMERSVVSNSIVFSNALWMNRVMDNGFDMPVRLLNFQCIYDRNYTVLANLQPVIHQTGSAVSKRGSYDVSLNLCKVSTCPEVCPTNFRVNKGAVYTIGQRIHLDIFASFAGNVSHDHLFSAVSEMFLSCNLEPNRPRVADLLTSGCSKSDVFQLDARSGFVNTAQFACVSFLVPRALLCSQVYIHATVQICHRDELQTCASNSAIAHCSSRRKRSTDRSSGYPAVTGPISIITGANGARNLHLGLEGREVSVDNLTSPAFKTAARHEWNFVLLAVGAVGLFASLAVIYWRKRYGLPILLL